METLDQRILNLIKNYMGKLWHKKVLTSMEEVEANTNETNLVAAPVVSELYNKLTSALEWKELGTITTVNGTLNIPDQYNELLFILSPRPQGWLPQTQYVCYPPTSISAAWGSTDTVAVTITDKIKVSKCIWNGSEINTCYCKVYYR